MRRANTSPRSLLLERALVLPHLPPLPSRSLRPAAVCRYAWMLHFDGTDPSAPNGRNSQVPAPPGIRCAPMSRHSGTPARHCRLIPPPHWAQGAPILKKRKKTRSKQKNVRDREVRLLAGPAAGADGGADGGHQLGVLGQQRRAARLAAEAAEAAATVDSFRASLAAVLPGAVLDLTGGGGTSSAGQQEAQQPPISAALVEFVRAQVRTMLIAAAKPHCLSPRSLNTVCSAVSAGSERCCRGSESKRSCWRQRQRAGWCPRAMPWCTPRTSGGRWPSLSHPPPPPPPPAWTPAQSST